jgi:arylsulfatase
MSVYRVEMMWQKPRKEIAPADMDERSILSRKEALRMLAGAVLTMNTEPEPSRAKSPNIIIILTDDQGFGDIGVFGAKGYKTPNLDRMAEEGRKLTNFHVAQPVCGASRAALLTGCYPNRIGLHGAPSPGSPIGLSDTETTLAQLLKQRGYATGMAGKWHLGDHKQFLPTRHGFDEYFGLPYSNDMWPFHPEVGERFPPLPLIEGDRIIKNGLDHQDQEQLTTQYTERAVQFIESHKERPFFFYLAHNMPHVPLHVSDKFKGKSARGLYGDVIEEIDWSVGEVLKSVQRCGIDQHTLVVFLSDNGPWLSYGDHAGSAGPLREGKGTSWEGGTRVPFIARWPGKISAGSTSDDMLCSIDLFPTIARLTDAKLPQRKIDGLDAWPTLSGQPGAKNPHAAYFWYYEQNQLQAVSTGDGRWKLVLPHTYRTLNGRPGGTAGIPVKYEMKRVERPELYDLRAEISERADVSAGHPDVVKNLLAEAEKARADMGDALTGRMGSGTREPGRIAPVPS